MAAWKPNDSLGEEPWRIAVVPQAPTAVTSMATRYSSRGTTARVPRPSQDWQLNQPPLEPPAPALGRLVVKKQIDAETSADYRGQYRVSLGLGACDLEIWGTDLRISMAMLLLCVRISLAMAWRGALRPDDLRLRGWDHGRSPVGLPVARRTSSHVPAVCRRQALDQRRPFLRIGRLGRRIGQ